MDERTSGNMLRPRQPMPPARARPSGLRLRLATAEEIRAASHGEVTSPDLVDALTERPIAGGLFCERVFGPVGDGPGPGRGEGPGRRAREHPRRERMGHIELAVPVAHSWFVHGTSCHLADLLGLPPAAVRRVVYGEARVVVAIDEERRGELA